MRRLFAAPHTVARGFEGPCTRYLHTSSLVQVYTVSYSRSIRVSKPRERPTILFAVPPQGSSGEPGSHEHVRRTALGLQ